MSKHRYFEDTDFENYLIWLEKEIADHCYHLGHYLQIYYDGNWKIKADRIGRACEFSTFVNNSPIDAYFKARYGALLS